MADTKISALTSATSLTGTELVPVVQSGVTKQAAISLIPGMKLLARDTFSASGTWTKPTGAKLCVVQVIGGGGGGASGQAGDNTSNRAGGGGASGGGIMTLTVDAGDLNATETVVIGAAGTGAVGSTTPTNGTGTDGGASSFGTKAYAVGGQRGVTTSGGSLSQRVTHTVQGASVTAASNGGGGGSISAGSSGNKGSHPDFLAATGGGGGGGGLSTASAVAAGGDGGSGWNGGANGLLQSSTALVAGGGPTGGAGSTTAAGTAGGTGTSFTASSYFGDGGAGGGGRRQRQRRRGGAGAIPGGGGGGGGASRNDVTHGRAQWRARRSARVDLRLGDRAMARYQVIDAQTGRKENVIEWDGKGRSRSPARRLPRMTALPHGCRFRLKSRPCRRARRSGERV
jgi:hypothetical protein